MIWPLLLLKNTYNELPAGLSRNLYLSLDWTVEQNPIKSLNCPIFWFKNRSEEIFHQNFWKRIRNSLNCYPNRDNKKYNTLFFYYHQWETKWHSDAHKFSLSNSNFDVFIFFGSIFLKKLLDLSNNYFILFFQLVLLK